MTINSRLQASLQRDLLFLSALLKAVYSAMPDIPVRGRKRQKHLSLCERRKAKGRKVKGRKENGITCRTIDIEDGKAVSGYNPDAMDKGREGICQTFVVLRHAPSEMNPKS